MAHISWSKTIVNTGTGVTSSWSGGMTLSLSVSGNKVSFTLTRDSDNVSYAYVGYHGTPNWSEDLPAGDYEQSTIVRWEYGSNSVSGTFTVTTENGSIYAYLYPSNEWDFQSGDRAPSIMEAYYGAQINHAPTCSVSIPQAIAAGSTIPVNCIMSDTDGDVLTGVLKRYYRAAGMSSYTATTISNALRSSTVVYDTMPSNYGGGKVYYELTVTDGTSSVQATSATRTISSNSAPTTPSSLTIPTSIAGDSTITITWEASTDPDGNLAGYVLERSTDGGSTWSERYRGDALTTTDHIPAGTAMVRYRVKAYDTYNAESGYKNAPSSGDTTVTNNHAPTKPESPITIAPTTLSAGGTAVISWGESSDPDGDNFNYVLERSANNLTSYEAIYTGTNRTYTDTVGSWSTVSYRVKAVDVHGAGSDYLTAATKTVQTNSVPTITCATADGTDLGTKSAVFSVTYSVDDADSGDTLTVKEIVDGQVKKTFTATRNTEYTFNFRSGSTAASEYWNQLLNGSHTIVLSVTDGKATVKRTFTFLKSVGACTITLSEAITSAQNIETAVVSICGNIPAGGLTTVQVTADDGTHWEDCILSSGAGVTESGLGNRKKTATGDLNEELIEGHYLFIHTMTNTGKKFNFRIQAEKVNSVGGWIGSVQGTFTEAAS